MHKLCGWVQMAGAEALCLGGGAHKLCVGRLGCPEGSQGTGHGLSLMIRDQVKIVFFLHTQELGGSLQILATYNFNACEL